MAQTIKELLDYIEEVKPNDYTDEIKVRWLNELEGMVQTELLLLPVEGIIRYKWPEDKDAELIVKEPHDKIYEDFILWKLDQMMGEAERANNSGAIFNDAWSEYARWIAMNIDPQGGYAERNLYYLTAYQTAVKIGFVGSEEEWIESLKGEKGDTGHGLQILGEFDSYEELIEAVPDPAEGDAYLVGASLFIFANGEWINYGSLRGEPGQDGISPAVAITPISGGNRVTITDKDGQHSAEIMDGQPGQDGISPAVAITPISGGNRVTITDKDGQHSFNVMDGQGGGGGTSIHGQLTGRSDADQHPISAITGLRDELDSKMPADTPIPQAVTESTVAGWGFTKNTGTYSKPSTGIPKSDLASAVQTSLGKADSALQSVPSTYRTAAAQDVIDAEKQDVIDDLDTIRAGAEIANNLAEWAKATNKPSYTASEVGARSSSWTPTKSQVGLGSVDNVRQYSASNPPPYPVTSVNGQTGVVNLDTHINSLIDAKLGVIENGNY